MQTQLTLTLNEDLPETTQDFALFNKYKMGFTPFSTAFRLYSTDGSCEDEDSESEEDKFRGKYRRYTLKEKEQAVEKIMNGHDVKAIAAEFGIPRNNLLRWKKNGCERKEGGGRPADHNLEIIIYEKLKNNEIKGEKQIRAAAREASTVQNFKASKGWFSKFCRRYKIQTGFDL